MNYKVINKLKIYSPKSRDELIDYAFKNKKILIALNAEKILHSKSDLQALIDNNIGYPDGIGAVMALNKKGMDNAFKIPGCELWLDIIKTHYKEKSFYLIGGKKKVIQTTVEKLKEEFIGIKICNYRNGFFKGIVEKESLIKDVIKHKPDVVFVAMGSPSQEYLMESIHKRHTAVYQGLGGSFDLYIGKTKRAPKSWIKRKLEWAFRLISQPRRIKRQIHLIRFYLLLKLNKF